MRFDVEEGSKPAREGVMRALRFCVIESSMEDRDIRRKSAQGVRHEKTEQERS